MCCRITSNCWVFLFVFNATSLSVLKYWSFNLTNCINDLNSTQTASVNILFDSSPNLPCSMFNDSPNIVTLDSKHPLSHLLTLFPFSISRSLTSLRQVEDNTFLYVPFALRVFLPFSFFLLIYSSHCTSQTVLPSFHTKALVTCPGVFWALHWVLQKFHVYHLNVMVFYKLAMLKFLDLIFHCIMTSTQVSIIT